MIKKLNKKIIADGLADIKAYRVAQRFIEKYM